MGSKTCGNCATTQPFNEPHLTCLNMECTACGRLKAKTPGGCKHWTGNAEARNGN